MITGKFDTIGRPFFDARITIPSLRVSLETSLLLDTGADTVVLMPSDAASMGIDVALLPREITNTGIGGQVKSRLVDAVITFTEDDKRLVLYTGDIVAELPRAGLSATPTILGRRIINKWAVTYNPTNGLLSAVVNEADLVDDSARMLRAVIQSRRDRRSARGRK